MVIDFVLDEVAAETGAREGALRYTPSRERSEGELLLPRRDLIDLPNLGLELGHYLLLRKLRLKIQEPTP